MKPSHLMLSFLCLALTFTAAPAFAQPSASPPDAFKARIDAAIAAVGNNPRFKTLSPKYRQELAEFVSGNMLFTLLHELAHAAIDQMSLPVLGKEEDAADSFAATRLIGMGSEFSDQIVAAAAKGWFLADRRDQKEGEVVPYYDEHGLNQQRAYQIVCYVVGSNKDKFQDLAAETKLPKERQDSCHIDYSKAFNSWNLVLKPHLRAPDQPKNEISVAYGDATGRLEVVSQIARSILLLEIVARAAADRYVWPTPIALEMRSCGDPNAAWVPSTHKLTLCYELATDFSDLYRTFGAAPTNIRKAKSK
jgi:hypothetical protein